ncbi:hypothetical protein Btru_071622 [Bulinus truncatus]|nr:hypothetical protein Btru_071622 [Bulinus truncatus]
MSQLTVHRNGQKQGSIKTQNSELVKLLTDSQSGNKDNKRHANQRLVTPPASENVNFSVSSSKESNGHRTQKVSDKRDKESQSLANNRKQEILAPSEKENHQGRQLQSFPENRLNRQKLVSVNWDPGSFIDTDKSYRKPDLRNRRGDALLLGGDEKEVILSDIAESDRDTLGSSSSELAALKSPSRGSQNTGDESSPKPTLTDDFVERDDTDTPTFSHNSPSPVILTRSGRGTPHPRGTGASAKTSHSSDSSEVLPDHSSQLEPKTHTYTDYAAGQSSPVQTYPSRKPDLNNIQHIPLVVASVTPRGSLLGSVRDRPLVTSTDIQDSSKSDSRFTTPYSSQRLKPQGDAAKRSNRDSLSVHQENSIEIEADSLDFVKDSLEVTATQGVKKENLGVNVARDGLVDSLDILKHEEENKAAEPKDEHVTGGHFNPVVKTEGGIHKISESLHLLSVSDTEKQLSAPDVHVENIQVKRQVSIKYDETSTGQVEKPVFILISDQRRSRTSSVHTTDRASHHNLDSLQAPRTASITHHPMKGSSSSNRVYVTSLTFSDEDDMQYRLVSSRLDGEDGEDTYRELDMAAIQSREAYSGGGSKLPLGKHVTYSDSSDSSVPKPQANNKNPQTSEAMMNPYGLKMATDLDNPDQPYPKKPSEGLNIMPDQSPLGGVQQGRIISHNPHLSGQALGQSHLPQPKEPSQRPSRVRGISLPTGPTYDPRDEEDLQRETSYQEES